MEKLWNILSPLLGVEKKENVPEPPEVIMQESKLSLAQHHETVQTTAETEQKLKEHKENFEGDVEVMELATVFAEYLEHTLTDEQKGTLFAEWKGEEIEGIVAAYIKMSTTAQVLTTLVTWAVDLTGSGGMQELVDFSNKLREANNAPDLATRNEKLREMREFYRQQLPAEVQKNFQGYVQRETNYTNTFAQLRAQDQQTQIQNNPQPKSQIQNTDLIGSARQVPQAEYQEQLFANTQLERARRTLAMAAPHVDTCPYGW